MSGTKLARMANDIAAFFQSYPHDKAVAGIQDHIKAFWTPKMRTALRDAVGAGTAEFHLLVVEAMTQDPQARSPVEKEAAGPAEVGAIGASDAG